jgi:hypothetical protein
MIEIYRIDSTKTKELLFAGAWPEAKLCWLNQLVLLRKGIHPKDSLQKHFDKFGEDDLVMKAGKRIAPENLQTEMKKFLAVTPEAKKETTQITSLPVEKNEIKEIVKPIETRKASKPKGSKLKK